MMGFLLINFGAMLFGVLIGWTVSYVEVAYRKRKAEQLRIELETLNKQYPNTVHPRYQEYWFVARNDYITDLIMGSYIFTDDIRDGMYYYRDGDRYISGRVFLLLHLLHKLGIRVEPHDRN